VIEPGMTVRRKDDVPRCGYVLEVAGGRARVQWRKTITWVDVGELVALS
jgi:hypothetical protein